MDSSTFGLPYVFNAISSEYLKKQRISPTAANEANSHLLETPVKGKKKGAVLLPDPEYNLITLLLAQNLLGNVSHQQVICPSLCPTIIMTCSSFYQSIV